MSKIIGWYYLHVNHDLIYKRDSPGQDADIRESDFATALWLWDGERATAWNILVEALSLGANPRRVKELADLWGCDDQDAVQYANFVGAVIGTDGNQKTAWRHDFINLQESPVGFGDTYLEALASLCRLLGYTGGKMWYPTFYDLLRNDKIVQSEPARS